ncbi:hypothetical protein H8D99_01270 [bacterium]|nr:hypothetical protein [bacterium]
MTQHEQALVRWRVVFLVCVVLLTVATHLPQATPSDNPTLDMPDKLYHFVFFGAVGFLFMCSGIIRNVYLSWFIIALWTFLDEYTQDLLPINRPFSVEDLISGELGVYAAYCWAGALRNPRCQHIKERVDMVLASTKNWICLAGITVLTLILTTATLWYGSTVITGTQYSEPAFLIGTLVSILVGMFTIKRIGHIKGICVEQKISVVWQVIGTIGLALLVGYATSNTFIDPWVVALFTLILCGRFIWDTATKNTHEQK